MKMRLTYFVVVWIFQCTVILEAQDTVNTSRPGGGRWDDPNTWYELKVPGKETNVTITSDSVWLPVAYAECKNLTVNSGALLTIPTDVGGALTVYGNIVNDGAIRYNDHRQDFWLGVNGNITNNGTWKVGTVELIGTKDQELSMASGKAFEGEFFNNMDTSGVIKATTDLTFKTGTNFFVYPTWTTLDMQNHNLVLDGINRPTLDYLNLGLINGAVILNPKSISCINNGVLQSVDCKGTYGLNDTVLLAGYVTFEGAVTVNGKLRHGAAIGYLGINGNIINNGLIDEDVSIEITGDITNNGIWKAANTYLYTNGSNRKIKGTFVSRVNLQQTGEPAAGNVQVDGILNNKSELFLWSGILEVLSSGALYNYGTINFMGGSIVNKGKIVYPRKITSPGNYSFYHGAANVPSVTNLDSLLFEHYGYQILPTFGNACKSRWNIITVPAVNMQPTATSITFYYEDDELGSNTESALEAWHSMNADTWAMVSTPANIVRDADGNSITLTNVPLFGNYGFASSTPVSVKRDNEVVLPTEYSLYQNYPNPFNPSTKIRFSVPTTSYVSLKIYDLLGRDISMLTSQTLTAGTYEMKFDGSSLTSGIYFYRLQAGGFSETRKFVLQK